jgi:pantoate--beta-alanine ligase
MRTVEAVAECRSLRKDWSGPVGFVPTMGALHRGHASLMEKARDECEKVAVSIFVNPTQFGPGEDFQRYPRTREADLELCQAAGADLVWFPAVEELYPPGSETFVEVSQLGGRFEGRARPGHFRGVATVVSKLFHVVQPTRGYFGSKDLQQLFLIRKMVADLLIPVQIVGVPTARDSDGLALSSRNRYLDAPEREKAPLIYQGLKAVCQAHSQGVREPLVLEQVFHEKMSSWEEARVERFDLLSPELEKRYEKGDMVEEGFCAVAVRVGSVRLIDNMSLCC